MKSPLKFSTLLLVLVLTCVPLENASLARQKADQSVVTTIEIWPDGLPVDAKPLSEKQIEDAKAEMTEEKISYVSSPSLSVYQAPPKNSNGAAVVICPGGGYTKLAWKKEGIELAQWFNSIGVTAFVLKYRVPRRDPQRIHHEPMQDVQRAIRIVRSQAEQYKIDSGRIGVLGFSAGGHLTVMAGTQYETNSYQPVDEVDELSCRPDFICPIYAAFLGNNYKDDVVELGDLVNVTQHTPPTFLAVTADDKLRGAQSALLFAKLCEFGVDAEIHVWQHGGHGYGIRKSGRQVDGWEEALKVWLQENQLLTRETKPAQ